MRLVVIGAILVGLSWYVEISWESFWKFPGCGTREGKFEWCLAQGWMLTPGNLQGRDSRCWIRCVNARVSACRISEVCTIGHVDETSRAGLQSAEKS